MTLNSPMNMRHRKCAVWTDPFHLSYLKLYMYQGRTQRGGGGGSVPLALRAITLFNFKLMSEENKKISLLVFSASFV